MSSDPRPANQSPGVEFRTGYAPDAHSLEWPDASGDCGPVDGFGHETFGGREPRLIIWDAKGRVLLRIDE